MCDRTIQCYNNYFINAGVFNVEVKRSWNLPFTCKVLFTSFVRLVGVIFYAGNKILLVLFVDSIFVLFQVLIKI